MTAAERAKRFGRERVTRFDFRNLIEQRPSMRCSRSGDPRRAAVIIEYSIGANPLLHDLVE